MTAKQISTLQMISILYILFRTLVFFNSVCQNFKKQTHPPSHLHAQSHCASTPALRSLEPCHTCLQSLHVAMAAGLQKAQPLQELTFRRDYISQKGPMHTIILIVYFPGNWHWFKPITDANYSPVFSSQNTVFVTRDLIRMILHISFALNYH